MVFYPVWFTVWVFVLFVVLFGVFCGQILKLAKEKIVYKLMKTLLVFILLCSVAEACHIVSYVQPQCRPIQFYCNTNSQWMMPLQSNTPVLNSEQGNVQGGSRADNTIPFDVSSPQPSLAQIYPSVFPTDVPTTNNFPLTIPPTFYGWNPPLGIFDPRGPKSPPIYSKPDNPHNPGNKPPPNKPKPEKPKDDDDDDCDPPVIRPVPEGSTLANLFIGGLFTIFCGGCVWIRKRVIA